MTLNPGSKPEAPVAVIKLGETGGQPTLVVIVVVVTLGLIALGCLGGGVGLRLAGKDAPGELWGFGGTAMGALIGLLSPSPTRQ